jgi:hypothetical protein
MLLDHDLTNSKTKRIKIKCDRCQIEIEKTIGSIIQQRAKRNGEDVCKRCSTIEYNQTRSIESRKKAGDGYKNRYKGKKLEEIVGENKATEIKLKHSKASTGTNNVNFGGKYSKGFADNPISGSLESNYGEEKAKEIKSAMSKRTSGERNPMYGKPAPKRSGNGLSGRYRGIYFRSLLELSFMLELDSKNVEFFSCETNKDRFKYELDGVKKTYCPDFFIPATNEFIEIKPSQMLKNREVKIKANAVLEAGEKIIFITQKDMTKIKREELLILIENGIVVIDKGKESWL